MDRIFSQAEALVERDGRARACKGRPFSAFSLTFGLMIAAWSLLPVRTTAGGLAWSSQGAALKLTSGQKSAVVEFPFRNDTGHPVRILSMTPSCDCVTAQADKVIYAPGESGTIRAEFTVGGSEEPIAGVKPIAGVRF